MVLTLVEMITVPGDEAPPVTECTNGILILRLPRRKEAQLGACGIEVK